MQLVITLRQISRRNVFAPKLDNDISQNGRLCEKLMNRLDSGRSQPDPAPASSTMGQTDSSARQLSRLVVWMSVYYTICMVLPSLLFIIRLAQVEIFHPEKDVMAAVICDILVISSAAANFIFYFLLWRHFRKTFFAMFCGKTCSRDETEFSSSYRERALKVSSRNVSDNIEKETIKPSQSLLTASSLTTRNSDLTGEEIQNSPRSNIEWIDVKETPDTK